MINKPINQWCNEIHRWARKQGFYEQYDNMLEANALLKVEDDYTPIFLAQRISLLHSEVTEILEAVRDCDDAHELEEVADVAIRLFDYAAFRGFALEQAIDAKMKINEHRPYKHGKAVF